MTTPPRSAEHVICLSAMLADWILSAAPGFDGEEDGDQEFQALPSRMAPVSATPATLRGNQAGLSFSIGWYTLHYQALPPSAVGALLSPYGHH